MLRIPGKTVLICSITIILAVTVAGMVAVKRNAIVSCKRINRLPVIDPDYNGTVIPCNIAPCNFRITEKGKRFHVKLYGDSGDTIGINAGGSSGLVNIPAGKWKKLLRLNRGSAITFDIYAKNDGKWYRYDAVKNRVAPETIDEYLVYRNIYGYKSIPEMEIRQRRLGGFDEKVVLNNRTLSTTSLACINCHSFRPGKPETMIIHQRGNDQGMLLVRGDSIVKIDTRTEHTAGPASYASWHPSGDLIAFAVMNVNQVLRSVGDPRVVIDEASDLIIYNVRSNTISTNPKIADRTRMETLPEWSPDGRYLYFCSAPQPDKVDGAFYAGLKYREIKYDLMRIPYDVRTGSWGSTETVLSAQETGMSNVHPKLSPDGKFMLFVTMPFSYFAVYDDGSDLCLLELSTGTYRRLDALNSDYAESFHSWSSNGRWFVFSSRRRDGLCTHPYFAYIDTYGNVSKPFLLPQRDPERYSTQLKSFNVPVLIGKPVNVNWRALSRAATDPRMKMKVRLDPAARFDGVTSASKRR